VCDGVYKISDIVIAGVSMAVTQRSEFAQVIQRNGGQVEGLLSMTREKIA
jgi:phospholipid transport system substrate-binding protein